MYDPLRRPGDDDKKDDEKDDRRDYQKVGTGEPEIDYSLQNAFFWYTAIASFIAGSAMFVVHCFNPDYVPYDALFRYSMALLSSSILAMILLAQNASVRLRRLQQQLHPRQQSQVRPPDCEENETENPEPTESQPGEGPSKSKAKKKKRKGRR